MAERNDILLDDNFDLIIKNGDLHVGESTQQHQKLLLISEKGEFKQSPWLGVAMQNYLLGDNKDLEEFKKEVKKQFELDGMEIDKISGSEIQAHYTE